MVVRHRNANEPWSATPIALGTAPFTYDFTTASTMVYGGNMIQKDPNIWALYSGDVNTDRNVDLIDISQLETDLENFSFGYFSTDINGDGNVDLLDIPIVEENISNFTFSAHP